MRYKPSQGIALITAILVVSLATIAATAMTTRNYVNFRRSENVLYHEQAYLYLLGAEDWARNVLMRDRNNNDTDSFKDDWATQLTKIPLEGGQISGKVEDLQGRFNLNTLANAQDGSVEFDRFRRMLVNAQASPDLLNAIVDWMDADQEVRVPGGAEDVDYLYGATPYRTANQFMQSPSELLLVKGMTNEIYKNLQPNVTALSQVTDINVNTAPAGVLQCIVEDLSAEDAATLITERNKDPFKSVEEFLQHPLIKGKKLNTMGLTVSSKYFMLTATAEVGRIHATLQSIMYRIDAKSLRVIARSEGGL
ncbi:MAG: type II secretion system minor pseudopilin GspK [Gammaproteobacteria bacterium]|nr:type II secretion system minor pseudopilin GspK [Gammaproteobacteria bacterium]